MKNVFLLYNQDEGCRYHRILSPARYLKGDLPDVNLYASGRADEAELDHSLYVVHGLPLPETVNRMVQHQQRKRKWVWSIDDDYTTVPDWNPCRLSPGQMASFETAKRLADYILVSTRGLADTFRDIDPDRLLVAPNLIAADLYPFPAPARWPDDRNFCFLWAGSHTHTEDVAPIEKAVRHIIESHAPRRKVPVEFVFFGQAPPRGLLTDFLHRGVHWQQGVDLGLYWAVLAGVRPHVVLAPLADCPFNLSKSNIRILDGWGLSAAVVASPVGEYAVVEDGVDGLVARDEDEWVHCLERLIDDESLRRRLAVAGRERLMREYDWKKWECRAPWRHAFAKALDLPVAELNGQAVNRLEPALT